MSVRRMLRGLVARKQGLVVPGAFDGVSVRLVERAGFEAVYMTGYGTSASRLGLPDLGYAGLAEMADHARNLAAAVSIPLVASGGAGEPEHLRAALAEGGADAALAASIFHFGTYTVGQVKQFLSDHGVPMRLI